MGRRLESGDFMLDNDTKKMLKKEAEEHAEKMFNSTCYITVDKECVPFYIDVFCKKLKNLNDNKFKNN